MSQERKDTVDLEQAKNEQPRNERLSDEELDQVAGGAGEGNPNHDDGVMLF
ncbi:MAG: hypothetical protein AB7D51_00165 [Desulfovibrionaceae bacterium]